MALTTTTVGPQIVSRPSLVPYCPASFLEGGGMNLKSVGVGVTTPKKLLKILEGMVVLTLWKVLNEKKMLGRETKWSKTFSVVLQVGEYNS